ncbi:MAG: hypothetical protein KC964_06970 [Candidatus Omnitrophica bacterium]|nr:hypothetical protein [Candidatus Omnitrophota bacterium]
MPRKETECEMVEIKRLDINLKWGDPPRWTIKAGKDLRKHDFSREGDAVDDRKILSEILKKADNFENPITLCIKNGVTIVLDCECQSTSKGKQPSK